MGAGLMSLVMRLRMEVAQQLGSTEFGAGLRLRLQGRSSLRPSPDTALTLEGFPRSGNTFLRRVLADLAPLMPVASHTHMAGMVKRSVRLRVPTIVVWREPIACLASNSRAWPKTIEEVGIEGVAKWWLQFYSDAMELRHSGNPNLVIMEFLEHNPVTPTGILLSFVRNRVVGSAESSLSSMDLMNVRSFVERVERAIHQEQNNSTGILHVPSTGDAEAKAEAKQSLLAGLRPSTLSQLGDLVHRLRASSAAADVC